MTTQPSGGYDLDALQRFLAEYGFAVGAGDHEELTSRFNLPALVVGQDSSTLVSSPEEVLALSRDRPGADRARDAVATVPEVVSIEEVGWGLLWVDVRWSYRDEYAAETTAERYRYLLRRGRDTFEVCVLVPLPD
ncbi:hypothetical protein LEP48_09095 [Isoptericola sp. NEAU-Y5]|uniref:Uncharacterized protein n=1 Tax=Isoptericola luteus TaxID=2879484 RepID=A0ABS7ZEQ6_9MICO|nr:hypothetical protein [Isoptericola sp. NEAU-Y5]MCA5893507.1 hypothetical protein [Isoptericola sp. NEAU-Y5]